MANIVVAFHNFLLTKENKQARPPFYEAFLEGLKEAGNNVLCFEQQIYKRENTEQIPKEYLEEITKFSPDLFIIFNNQFWDISKLFDIPIIIYDVDSPNSYCNLNILKNNKERYLYLCNQYDGKNIIKEIIGSTKSLYVPPFTAVKSLNVQQNIDISFLGACWVWNDFNSIMDFVKQNPSLEERNIAKQVYKSFIDNPYIQAENFYEILNLYVDKKIKFSDIKIDSARISGIKRLRYLTEIADLNLEIRGTNWFSPMLKMFPEAMLCYSSEPVYDLKTTEKFFNSSKIGFNTKHIQAKSGFSWRVCDILASNACLVTEEASDLTKLGFDVPMFTSPIEAREVCQKLLANDNWRQEIVESCHQIIEKNHRFKNILPQIEDFLKIKLHSDKIGSCKIIQVWNDALLTSKSLNIPNFPYIDKNSLKGFEKINYKIARYFYKKLNRR